MNQAYFYFADQKIFTAEVKQLIPLAFALKRPEKLFPAFTSGKILSTRKERCNFLENLGLSTAALPKTFHTGVLDSFKKQIEIILWETDFLDQIVSDLAVVQ